MDITQIVFLLTPLLVWLATKLVRYVLSSLPGWVVVLIVVPILSIVITSLASIFSSFGDSFWVQVVYGLLAVFVNELVKQFKTK